MHHVGFPAELWSSQVEAIKSGLLDANAETFGLSSPTGTGKTFITRLLLLQSLVTNPGRRVLYIVPTRALVNEVASDLRRVLQPLGFEVLSVTPQIVELQNEEQEALQQASVAVLTPEKADLLLRLEHGFMKEVGLVVVDEAHLIEAGARGILLEQYLWRVRRLVPPGTRTVLLSAVAPNIRDITAALGAEPRAVNVVTRGTRMKVGVYRVRQVPNQLHPQGWIDYTDGTSLCLVRQKPQSGQARGLVEVAARLVNAGPVLVVARGKGTCESLARLTREWLVSTKRTSSLSDTDLTRPEFRRLDSRLEREMYGDVPMREFIRHRIAYHHAGLPPRVRIAVEEAIRQRLVDYVFATRTLAEGVNFPFSSVVVQALAIREPPQLGRPLRYRPVTPRTFWNIAGRAGRPGFDREGQIILFEPSLGLERVNYVLQDYLDSNPQSVRPVTSALATGIREIQGAIQSGTITAEALNSVSLSTVPPALRGTVNLLRVGIVHGRAAGLIRGPEDIVTSSFASTFLDADATAFASNLMQNQGRVVDAFLTRHDVPSEAIVAQIGLSLETLENLSQHIHSLDQTSIERASQCVMGGQVISSRADQVLSQVANLMTELDGTALGGFLSQVISSWVNGMQFVSIKTVAPGRYKTIEDLIAVIYSRIQYLLPWGLYAYDLLLAQEARQRAITYEHGTRSLAYLADAGVPTFDALRLVNLEFERVDATRLAEYYRRRVRSPGGPDIVGWLLTAPRELLRRIIRGQEGRSLDYDFERLLDGLQRVSTESNGRK